MATILVYISVALLCCASCVSTHPRPIECSVYAHTHSGWVCGVRRWTDDGKIYASFRGIPYAKQPVGKLRFKELEPVESWDDMFDAAEEGPVCPQHDFIYGPLMKPQGMSEACIHVNVHIPLDALPTASMSRKTGEPHPPYYTGLGEKNGTGLPIFVFIHGGGFTLGSGDADVHGPEYLVSKGVIVVTFNYRVNVFGFLSLNSSSIPGNNGLRDQVTLLRWVQRNARAFGGDPNEVTIGGHSAGGASAHLLSLSDATKGLFKRIVLISGVGIRNFFSASPLYSQYISNQFLILLGIDEIDPEEIHRQLVEMPLEKIMDAVKILQEHTGLAVFVPVVESYFPGVTRIIDDDPEVLMRRGRGRDIAILAGYTTAECELFRYRFAMINIIDRINKTSVVLVPPNVIYKYPIEQVLGKSKAIQEKYYDNVGNLDNFLKYCSESYFIYPAIKVVQLRAAHGGAPAFLYQFNYEPENNALRELLSYEYRGVAHVEDMFYMFRINSVLESQSEEDLAKITKDDLMKDLMTSYIVNFMRCSDPTCNHNRISPWPAVSTDSTPYQDIENPTYYRVSELDQYHKDMVSFLDKLYES